MRILYHNLYYYAGADIVHGMKPQLIVQQKFTPLVNRYKILSPDDKKLLAMAQQKRFAFKEKVWFYADEERTQEIFSFRAEKIADVHGRFFVEDADGTMLGGFRKEFKKSLLRSSWVLLDRDGNDVLRIRESSKLYAVVRRFIEWVPIVGDAFEVIEWLAMFHFELVALDDSERLGIYKKTNAVRDYYVLESIDELQNMVDWRVLAAMAVALDALQAR